MKKQLLALFLCLLLVLGASAYAETYQASGQGMGGDVPVTVEIEDDKIVSVTIGNNAETEGIGTNAIEALPDAIIEAQSADIDVITGATITSRAILDTVNEILIKAGLVHVEGDAVSVDGPGSAAPDGETPDDAPKSPAEEAAMAAEAAAAGNAPGSPAEEAAEAGDAPESPAEEAAEAEETPAEEPGKDDEYFGETAVNDIFAKAEEKSKANAPKIVTLDNGVQIQRTPDDVGGYWHRPGNYNSYNTYYLNADNRGCAACHTSLIDLLDSMSYEHLTFKNGYGIELTAMDCMICHDDGDGYLYTVRDFGTLIHGIHSSASFDTMGGNCWSCHTATADGKGMLLWDEAKYDVLQGISFVSDVEGEFTWGQDETTDMAKSNMGYWMSGATDNAMYGASVMDLPLDEGVFDNWEITVDGDVENPFTMTLPQLMETFGTDTAIMTDACVMNPLGGPWISTAEVTGISFTKMLEYAGCKDTATAVMSYAGDGWNRGIYLTELEKDDALLAIELNGERLPWAFGYPCSTWNGAGSAASCIRNVVELRVVSDEHIKTFDGWHFVDDELNYSEDYINKPNVGIFNFLEGQIIPVGEAYTFHGYADAYDEAIAAIEFSLDRGKTWTHFDTPDTDRRRWVTWNFTYTPENVSSYVLSVRAITTEGTVNPIAEEIMFNAK